MRLNISNDGLMKDEWSVFVLCCLLHWGARAVGHAFYTSIRQPFQPPTRLSLSTAGWNFPSFVLSRAIREPTTLVHNSFARARANSVGIRNPPGPRRNLARKLAPQHGQAATIGVDRKHQDHIPADQTGALLEPYRCRCIGVVLVCLPPVVACSAWRLATSTVGPKTGAWRGRQ